MSTEIRSFNSGLAKCGKIIYVFVRVLCDKKSSLLISPPRLYLEGYRARSCIDSEDSKHTEKSPKQPPFSLLEALEKIKTCRCTVRIVSFVPYRIPPDPGETLPEHLATSSLGRINAYLRLSASYRFDSIV